jgi:phosphonate transport system ATP-binding protein
LARQYATRIIALKAGAIVFDGNAAALTDQRLEQIYGKAIFEEKAGEIDETERNSSF